MNAISRFCAADVIPDAEVEGPVKAFANAVRALHARAKP